MDIDKRLIKLFEKKCGDKQSNGCILWKGGIDAYGYGYLYFDNKRYSAHRLAYMIERNDIQPKKAISHTCGERSCVNVSHLCKRSPLQLTMRKVTDAKLWGVVMRGTIDNSLEDLIKGYEEDKNGIREQLLYHIYTNGSNWYMELLKKAPIFHHLLKSFVIDDVYIGFEDFMKIKEFVQEVASAEEKPKRQKPL